MKSVDTSESSLLEIWVTDCQETVPDLLDSQWFRIPQGHQSTGLSFCKHSENVKCPRSHRELKVLWLKLLSRQRSDVCGVGESTPCWSPSSPPVQLTPTVEIPSLRTCCPLLDISAPNSCSALTILSSPLHGFSGLSHHLVTWTVNQLEQHRFNPLFSFLTLFISHHIVQQLKSTVALDSVSLRIGNYFF